MYMRRESRRGERDDVPPSGSGCVCAPRDAWTCRFRFRAADGSPRHSAKQTWPNRFDQGRFRLHSGSVEFCGKYDPEQLLKHEFDASVFYSRLKPVNSFGANLVSAHADELGEIRIDECVAYYDVGRALNPAMIESQILGGSAQGIGQVLYEEAKYDEEGQLLAATIADAGLTRAHHMPNFIIKLATNTSSPHQPRGVGESATMGVPPAAIRAIERITGKKLTRTPIRPDTISSKEPSR